MPKYFIFEGNFKQLMDGIPPIAPPPEYSREPTKFPAYFYRPMTKAAYADQLEADIHRGHYISFKQPIIDIQSRLYNPDYYEGTQVFNQGDLSGQFLEVMLEMILFSKDEYRDKKTEQGNRNPYTSTLSFSYLDDDNIPCAFAIERFGLDGDATSPHKYLIYHIRNTIASAEQKQITLISEEELLQGMDAQTLSTNEIGEENIFTTIKTQIGSNKVYQLVSSLIENGQLSKARFDSLLSRLRANTNIDNRDVRQKILEEWLNCIRQIHPALAIQITEEATDDINFFETKRFEALLFERIHVPDKQSFKNIGPQLYAIQLRYLVSKTPKHQIKANETEKEQTTREQKEEEDKLAIYHKLIEHNPIFALSHPYSQVKQEIQRLKAAEQFQQQLYELDQYIHECRQPYRCEEANNLLQFCKNEVNFDTLSPYGQAQLITLIKNWSIFTQYPNNPENAALTLDSYQSIVTLYTLLGIREPERNHILETPEQACITWALQQQPHSFTFDPQGHIIYDTVDHQGYRITVSNDTYETPNLKEAYIHTVKEALLQEEASDDEAKRILTLLQAEHMDASTIRPVQQELHVFLSQLAHECQLTYRDPNFNEHDCQKVLNTTMQYTSELVMEHFARALIRASKDNHINVAAVNETLNDAWDVIAPDAKKYLYAQIATKLNQPIPKKTTTDKDCPFLRGASTPLIYTNHRLGVMNWIDSRHPNPHLTHREIQSFAFDPNNTSIIAERNHTQAIMPTVAFQQDLSAYQQELHEKLTYTSLFYSFEQSFSYHLFPEYKEITSQNLQKTVLTIHDFNRDNIETLRTLDKEYMLVLGFCDTLSMMPTHRPLGYRSYELSGLGNEATLMTEMALIQQLAPKELNNTLYKAFLVPVLPSTYREGFLALFRSTFFSQTKEGKRIRADIKNSKATWQDSMPIPNDIESLLTLSLKKIMAYNLHFGTEFNMLTQALSLAQSKQSLVAHSNDSRAHYFLGMTQLFDQHPIPENIHRALHQLAGVSGESEDDYEQAKEAATTLQNCLEELYREHNTYGAAMQAIAMDDKAVTDARLEIPATARAMIAQATNLDGTYSQVIDTMPAPPFRARVPAAPSHVTAKQQEVSEPRVSSKTAHLRKTQTTTPKAQVALERINRKSNPEHPGQASKPPRHRPR